jgi:translocation and assembly module TamA
VSFLSLETSGSVYQAADDAEHVILAGRFRVASVSGETTDTLPANKRLYSGGGGSVRGYKYRMVGPISATGAPSGGRSVAELGLESRIKVSQNVGIVPFVEGGAVYDGIAPQFPNNALWAGGLGLRYHTIVGPLRADLAFPLNGRPNIDSTFEFYISIGQAF